MSQVQPGIVNVDHQEVSLFVGQSTAGDGECEETLVEAGITAQHPDEILNIEKSTTLSIIPHTQEPEKV